MDEDSAEVQEYLLKYPTFDDLIFLDHDFPIDFDESDGEVGQQQRKLITRNGWSKLNLRARSTYKLLKQARGNIWSSRQVVLPPNHRQSLLENSSPESLAKLKNTSRLQNEAPRNEGNNSGNIDRRITPDLPNKKMASWHKPEKRKRGEDSNEEDESSHKKRFKKPPIHTVSSDDESDVSLIQCGQRMPSDIINGQISNRFSERPSSRLYEGNADNVTTISEGNVDDPANNSCVDIASESEEDGVVKSVQNASKLSKSQSTASSSSRSQNGGNSICSAKVLQEHDFIRSDEEEIAKFSLLLDEDLVENNNIWILQCPSNMNCSSLVGQEIDLGGCSKLEVGNKSYESFIYKSKGNRYACLGVPSHSNHLKLKRIPIAGNIIVEEFFDITSDSSFSIVEAPRCVALPDNLQTRHPLFGKNYKKQLKMAKRTEQLLMKRELEEIYSEQDAVESEMSSTFLSPKKQKKKKRMKELPLYSMNESYGNDSDMNHSTSSSKKKRRNKEDSSSRLSDISIVEESIVPSSSERKKRKESRKKF